MSDHTYDEQNSYLNDDSADNESQIYYNLTENNKNSDQLLIDLVRSYPHLWNKQEKCYKDTVKKETSWEEISTILNQSASVCQSRWQRLRQYYAKERQKQELERRSGSKAVSRMPWYLFSSMNFLDSHMYKRKTFTNLKKCTATIAKSHNVINDSMNKDQSASYDLCVTDTSDNENSSRESFLDLTNTDSISPLNSSESESAQFPKPTTFSIQRSSPILFPLTNIYTKPVPSSNSTLSFPLSSSKSTKSKEKIISDSLEDSFRTVSASVVQVSNQIIKKENEGRDHALANLVVKELQDAQEPKKSMLRKKIMQVLTDHINSSLETD